MFPSVLRPVTAPIGAASLELGGLSGASAALAGGHHPRDPSHRLNMARQQQLEEGGTGRRSPASTTRRVAAVSTAVATSQKAVVIASTSVSTTGSPPAASRSHPPVTVPPAALSAAARGSPAATGPSSRPAAQVDFASHTPIVATSTSFKQTDAGRLVQRLNDALRESSSRHVAESPYASSVQAGDCSHPRPGSPTVAIEMDPLPPRRLPFVASEADLSVRQKAVDAASGPKRTATMALYQPRTAEPASDDPAATTVSWTYGRQSPTRGLTANGP